MNLPIVGIAPWPLSLVVVGLFAAYVRLGEVPADATAIGGPLAVVVALARFTRYGG